MGVQVQLNLSAELTTNDSGIPQGNVSSMMMKDNEHMLEGAAPKVVYKIKDEPTALYVYALFTLLEPNIACISAAFVSLILTFFTAIQTRWEDMLDDIESRKINKKLNIPEHIRDILEQELAKYDETELNERLVFLRRELSKGMDGIALRLWPSLKAYAGISTGMMAIYDRKLKEKFLKDVTGFSVTYGSTEQLILGIDMPEIPKGSYITPPNVAFFEFIAEENTHEEQPKTLYMHQLTVGSKYEIVVTNSVTNIYRYRMGDIIKVVGYLNQVPIINYSHRMSQSLNLSSEKTSELVLYNAVMQSEEAWGGIKVRDYTTVENIYYEELLGGSSENKHYVMFVELEKTDSVAPTLSEEQKEMIDQHIRKQNTYYDLQRDKLSFRQCQVVIVQPGTFEKVRNLMLDSQPKSSRNQFKMPRVLRKLPCLQLLHENILEQSLNMAS